MAEKATLREIETHWSLDDLLECNEALDVMDELEMREQLRHERELEKAKRKK